MRIEITDDCITYKMTGCPLEIYDKRGICPNCGNDAMYNDSSGYYECIQCEWWDISLPATFICEHCGEEKIEAEMEIIDGEKICHQCKNYQEK